MSQEIWDRLYLDMAYLMASKSKDPSTKVGAVIVTQPPERLVVSSGYNGFPRGADDSRVERYDRPERYAWTVHSEINALLGAARNGSAPLKGCSMYVTAHPCIDCAKAICQAGIAEVVLHRESKGAKMVDEEMREKVHQLFNEVGVSIREVSYERNL